MKFRVVNAVLKCVFHVHLCEISLVGLKKENTKITSIVELEIYLLMIIKTL